MEAQPPVAPPRPVPVPRFDPPGVLWYFGAIAATVAAYTVISGTGTGHRGLWLFVVSLAFLAGAGALSAFALRFDCWIPAGVMAAAAAALIAPVVVGFEFLIGVLHRNSSAGNPFSDFKGSVFSVVLLSALGGLAIFWVVRFGFVLLPVVIATELLVQLFLPAVDHHPSISAHVTALLFTGAAFVVVGMLLDARRRRSPAFWWHVLGLFAIADALAYFTTADLIAGFFPLATHRHAWAWIAMIVLGTVLIVASFPVRRATWAVFGVAGVYAPALHYVNDETGSWHYPLVMVFVGVAIVFVGAILDAAGLTWPHRLARPVTYPPE